MIQTDTVVIEFLVKKSAFSIEKLGILIKKLTFLFIYLLILPSVSVAQTGTILGSVIDNGTGKPLENVQISISDYTHTTSDAYGNYHIRKVPPGEYTLSARMLGYTHELHQVQVGNGDLIVNEILMTSVFEGGDKILVENRKRSQAQSLTLQSESLNFSNVLTTQQMDAFGDRTIQSSLSRMPGVYIGYNEEINIRGAGFNQYKVLLDGQPVSSTGFGDRTVDLGGYSTDMVHQLELLKVVTPDMHADAIGGIVNLRTRRPAGIRAVTAYGGTGAHPEYFQYGGAGARAGLHYSEAIRRDLSFGLNLNYQQEHIGWERLDLGHDVADFGGGRTDVIRRISPGLHSNQHSRLAGSLQMNYAPTQNSVYHINGFYNLDDRTMDLHNNYWDTGGDWLRPDTTGALGQLGTYGYNARRQDYSVQQFSIQTGGRHGFDLLDLEYNVNWSSAVASQEQFNFPFARTGLNFSIDNQDRTRPAMTPTNLVLKRDGTVDFRVIRFQNLERTFNEHKDNTYSGNIDLTIPLSGISFKVGSSAVLTNKKGEYRETSYSYARSLDLYRFRMIPLGDINIFNEDAYYIPWLMDTQGGRDFFEANTPSFNRDVNQQRRDSDIWNYDHNEIILAGYTMGTLKFGAIHVMGGLRVEHSLATYEGRDVNFSETGDWVSTNRITTDQQATHLFPGAQIAYKPAGNFTARIAYSENISRPDYNRLSPFTLRLQQDSTLFRGNPALDPVTSQNLDFLLDYYSDGLGHIGFRTFYKLLSEFVVERNRLIDSGEFSGYTERFFDNSGQQAKLFGVEISWQQNLTFLPGFLGYLGTYANYTWSRSEFETDTRSGENPGIPGLSPHILNAALFYSRGRIFSQISYQWVAESLMNIAETAVWAPSVSGSDQVFLDQYAEGISDLSISFGFRISESFRFWADASNLIPSERIIYAHSRSVYPYQTNLNQGFMFRAGFSYNL